MLPSSPVKSGRLRQKLKHALISTVVLTVLVVLVLEWLVQRAEIPLGLRHPQTGTPTYVDREGDLLAIRATPTARIQIPTSLGRMGRWLPEVTIALEDHRFHTHPGVDVHGILAAAWSNVRRGKIRRGASTITQQLVKQALGKRGRQWKRKARETVLALKLERHWSKEEILEGYLNRLDYGNRRLGALAAAWAYFGKDCESLTLGEAIFLAGLPQAPTRYNPWKRPESAMLKYQRAVNRLALLGFIDEEQATVLREWPPSLEATAPAQKHAHFLQALELNHTAPLTSRIHTSLDANLQAQCESSLTTHLLGLDRHDLRNGAVVVIENDSGLVRALTSFATPQAESEAELNAALTQRHAGSTLKPFVYQHALAERQLTAATVLADTDDTVRALYADYDPKNFNKRTYGPVQVRQALGNSLNIPAIVASDRVGPRLAFQQLNQWGLSPTQSFEEVGAGFVLGNLRVSLLNLTQAYASLARGGIATAYPGFVEDAAPPMRRVTSSDACRIITDILSDNAARSQSFGTHSVLSFPEPHRTAAKTGTSSNARDAWVMGYNRDYTVGVWIGNLNGASMGDSLAVSTAGPVWRRVMQYLMVHYQARPLPPVTASATLRSVEIDTLSGLLPTTASLTTRVEWFLAGTEPITTSEPWYKGRQIVLPNEYSSWCQGPHNHLNATTEQLHSPAPTARILITSPRDGARYVFDPTIPSDAQRLPFLAEHPDAENLEWHLNGKRLDDKSPMNWRLQAGHWELTVHDSDTGRKGKCEFIVEP